MIKNVFAHKLNIVKQDEEIFVGRTTARFPFTPTLFAIMFPCKNIFAQKYLFLKS